MKLSGTSRKGRVDFSFDLLSRDCHVVPAKTQVFRLLNGNKDLGVKCTKTDKNNIYRKFQWWYLVNL